METIKNLGKITNVKDLVTKGYVDGEITTIDDAKADKDTTYTKTEVNGLLDDKINIEDGVEIVKLTDDDETLEELNERLHTINTQGRHVLFDTSAIDITDKLYLCTIYIDDYTNPTQYRLHDQVTGMTSIGTYDEDKTLVEILDEAMKDLVTITVTSITTDGVTVMGTTVTLRNGTTPDAPIIATQTYNGQPVSFVVAKDTVYYVQGSNLTGHFPVDAASGVATSDVSILFNYRDYGEVSTFEDVQIVCRAGVAQDALDIGQALNITKDGTTYPVKVMHFIENGKSGSIKLKNGLQEGVIFQTLDCLYSAQFDEREAFYACTDGLQAGDYYFRLGEHSWYAADVGKDFYFHFASDIPAGGQLVFTQAYNATLENATVNIFDSPTSYSPSQTATLSSTVISGATNLGTLTNAKVGKFNSCQRALFGNNNYKESALRQQINSNEPAGSVWVPQNIWDRAPSWRTSLKGFLNGLDSSVANYIQEVEIDTYRNTVCDGGGLDTTTDKIFLVGRNEEWFPQEGADNGVAWDYYKEGSTSNVPHNGADAIRSKKIVGATSNTYWWQRTPNVGNATNVRITAPDGSYNLNGAGGSNGVAPAFVIA